MTDATFDLSGSTISSTDPKVDQVYNLRVVDSVSGEHLVDVDIPIPQMWRLIGGTYLSDLPGSRSPRLDRVGKKMQTQALAVPRDVVTVYDRDNAVEAIKEWFKDQPAFAEWEEFKYRRTNSGWTIIARRWIDVMDV